MKNIRLSYPVTLPQGTIYKINPDAHYRSVRSMENLEEFISLLRETEAASRTYGNVQRLGAPDIILYRSYQKLQNAVWKLHDRFPVEIIRG